VLVDFAGYGNRYDILTTVDVDAQVSHLQTQVLPTFEWMTVPLPRAATDFHTYELVFHPSTQTADLSIDGVTRLTGYRGHNQFQEDRGLQFGAAAYKSPRGVGQFQSVRFEINP
jgi:hypothetical protein